jgi:uncharacterized protein
MAQCITSSLLEFVTKHTQQFDDSHNVQHALDVYKNAVMIATNDYPAYDTDILQYACMLHDVCDHKYANESISMDALTQFVYDSLPELKATLVLDIINNISYSQEIKGTRKTLPGAHRMYQDIVSDADKLEAIGVVGINRCIAYTQKCGGVIPADVVKHCHEKLLILYPDNYIRTPTGRLLAEPLHEQVMSYVRMHCLPPLSS